MRPAERGTVLMQFHDEPVARSPEIAILVVKESGARKRNDLVRSG
jgi:hypothetical protein